MLQRTREWLTFILLLLLPFHAFLVTVGTKWLLGPGHAPLAYLAIWKEVLILLIVLIAIFEIFGSDSKNVWSFDLIDWLILGGVLLASIVSLNPSAFAENGGFGSLLNFKITAADKRFLLGFKYDFLPLTVFFFMRRVAWSEIWLNRILVILAVLGVVIAVYGIETAFLPLSFFTSLGYSDMHSLYIPGSPLAAFQQIENSGIRRIQSVMSGPNQFGIWLLLPLSILIWVILKRLKAHLREKKPMRYGFIFAWLFSFSAISAALSLAYSRAAWVAASGILFVTVLLGIKRVERLGYSKKNLIYGVLTGALIFAALFSVLIRQRPDILIRTQSFADHLKKPLAAMAIIKNHPFGSGLGTAGPASNAFSDTCVTQPAGSDYSWAKNRSDVCIFIGSTQRFPADKVCKCPVLTENWYLQFGVEMGVLGLIFSLALAISVLWRLLRINLTNPALPILLTFLGISIAGLFLHSFEDSAVAYSVWILTAAVLSKRETLSYHNC